MSANRLIKNLKGVSDQKRAEVNAWFFKTGPGQYGEGDKFLGVTMPNCRKIAKGFLGLDFPEVEKVLASKWHEARMTGLVILTEQYKKATRKRKRNL